MTEPLHVVATAGHVDHGKSSLIVRLTGIDPDRWEEEKRRGLTIDLGFAWTTLPSGREVGFVDVPGHERFVANMLAGVGPVPLVLFVVAADEGWKPQSEEHLSIVDVLGAQGGVVALTKADLVDDATMATREAEIRERMADTVLAEGPIVPCSSVTGAGLDDLRRAIDAMLAQAPPSDDRGRPRIHLDRSFTIKGAGTVVTGTLTGGTLVVGDEIQIYPAGVHARIRSLQTHRRSVEVARPISRVAVNLAGVAKDAVERGDLLGRPGQWRPTSVLEVRLTVVRGASRVSTRGAYKVHVGATEREAALRLYGAGSLAPGEAAYGRLRLARPMTVAVGDRFVLRDTGRRATVAGGVVLDTEPPSRPGPGAGERLARRLAAAPDDLAGLIVAERGAVRSSELGPVSGPVPPAVNGAERVGPWWVDAALFEMIAPAVLSSLETYHRESPLLPGMEASALEAVIRTAAPAIHAALSAGLGTALLDRLQADGVIVREGTLLRLPGHRVSLGEREQDAGRLVDRVRAGEPTPPGIGELMGEGHPRELIDAAVAVGHLVRVSDDIVVTPELAGRAEEIARREAAGPEGMTVSRFRELLGTTRKYALPLLERLDRAGVTRRDGDVRRLR